MKGYLLLRIRFHGHWSRQASGRLIKVKYTGNSLGQGFSQDFHNRVSKMRFREDRVSKHLH